MAQIHNRGMLVVRRALAVPLGFVLLVVLIAAIAVEEIHDRLLNPDFLVSELQRLEVYDFLSGDIYPAAIKELLEEPDDTLPDSLQGLDVPNDAEAQAAVVGLMRVVAPASYLQEQVESVLGQVVPYLLNDSDTIELTPDFDERLRAAALAEPGDQSALEQTFRALGLGRRVIDQLIENAISDMGGADPEAALALRLTDRDDAGVVHGVGARIG